MKKINNFLNINHNKKNYFRENDWWKSQMQKVAKKYGVDYWDGNRKYGYGGYKYIPGRWKNVAIKIIEKFKLKIILIF